MQLVFESFRNGTIAEMEAPPPVAGPQPVLLTFEEFLAQQPRTTVVSISPNYSTTAYCLFNTITSTEHVFSNIQGTGGSSVGGGAGLRMTPKSRSPVTPIHRGGGGGGSSAGLGGSAAASSENLGFGRLGGEDLRSGPRRA